jgi:hypothetical protein
MLHIPEDFVLVVDPVVTQRNEVRANHRPEVSNLLAGDSVAPGLAAKVIRERLRFIWSGVIVSEA